MKLFGLTVFLTYIFCLEALKFDNPKSDILPSKEICGKSSKVEYPWLVFIPLQTRTYNPQANVRCAGVLISKRYVAIGKSCLQFVLTKVHLGQYDTSKDETCDGSKCSPVLKIDVEERVVDDSSDIVLLRLAEDVEFTDYIKPICLPFEGLKRAEFGETVYSSGWGLTTLEEANSLTKKQVKETLVSNEECQKSGNIQDAKDDKFICVKVQDDSTSKPCNGDEGSPVMYHSANEQWVLEGVLTWLFGALDKPCAITVPARGSRITEGVLEWIVEKIHA